MAREYTFTSYELMMFKRQWPCHGIPDEVGSLWFAFGSNGDLVDSDAWSHDGRVLPALPDGAGAALMALSEDALRLADGGSVDWL